MEQLSTLGVPTIFKSHSSLVTTDMGAVISCLFSLPSNKTKCINFIYAIVHFRITSGS